MNLLANFRGYIKSNNLFSLKDKLLLAVSGGVDSVVLCELCKQAGYNFSIAHCNFQLRGEESDKDEKFVESLAARLKVEYYSIGFDTKKIAGELKKGIEETARDIRYEWFQQLLKEHKLSCIVTGHHADDNIETMAMLFFRGTGIKGLRGMLPQNGKIVRPLLFARKQELEDYASANQLEFVTDYTNFEDAFARNFFRNRLIPLFKMVYPSVEQNLISNIERLADTEQLYEQAIVEHKRKLIEKRSNEFHIPVLKLQKSAPVRTIVYEIISDFGFTAHQADEVLALLKSETGKYISSPTHRIIKNRNWLIITPAATGESVTVIIEKGIREIQFPGGNLKITITNNAGATLPADSMTACLDAKQVIYPLLLRKWKTGDYFYPLGMKKKKKIARFLIDLKLSKTEKENTWVLESNKRIIWVVGYRIDERFKITEKTKETLVLTVTSRTE